MITSPAEENLLSFSFASGQLKNVKVLLSLFTKISLTDSVN